MKKGGGASYYIELGGGGTSEIWGWDFNKPSVLPLSGSQSVFFGLIFLSLSPKLLYILFISFTLIGRYCKTIVSINLFLSLLVDTFFRLPSLSYI